ncbi:MAG TPA: hypothetical protein VGM51_15265 [Armatimonadota bacterium]|jgi:hypothetical protein
MSDHSNARTPSSELPQRFGAIHATVTPGGMARNGAPGDLDELAAAAVRFFARRGLPIAAAPNTMDGTVTLAGRFDPSRHPLFRNVLSLWTAESGDETPGCFVTPEPGAADDEGGFRKAWAREERWQNRLDRIASDLGFRTCSGEGARWAQAAGGPAEHIRSLEDAFSSLRQDGRVSRFPRKQITVARQATCAPYGLPAVILKLKGTCRVFSERLGRDLLEASPRLISLTEVAPSVVLAENTPPLDNVWDDSRFWAAWQSLPPSAWEVVDAWAAVRVLRYVETPDGEWRFYAQTHQARNVVQAPEDLPAAPDQPPAIASAEAERWRRRRCCEIALALRLNAADDGGLCRHAIGNLAAPYPFVHRLNSNAPGVRAVETYLAKAATVLHWELLCREQAADGPVLTAEYAGIVRNARTGLRQVQQHLLSAACAYEVVDDEPATVAARAR